MAFEGKTKAVADPLLEFDSAEHVSTDPIFGLENWEPHRLPDLECIRVIAICQPQLVDSLNQFWSDLQKGFQGNPFVPYVGFRNIFTTPITDIEETINPDRKIGELGTRFAASIRDIESEVDIVFAVLPYDYPQDAKEVYNELKAASFKKQIKTQCIRRSILQRLNSQDHASDLWNISTGIFTKVGGTPWILKEKMSEVGCFVGLVAASSFRGNASISDKAGICEVIDNYGSHVIWSKEELPSMASIKENGRFVKNIESQETTKLVESCLDKYCRERLGANYQSKLCSLSDKVVVFHLTDDFSTNVLDTMEKAIQNFGLDRYQLVHLKNDTPYRLYSSESADLKPLRGTVWEINDENAVLYTHGRREYHRGKVHKTYSRFKRINPIGIEILRQNKGISMYDSCKHIVGLTGLCWYTTDIEMKMPVTIKIARRLSSLWKRGVLTDFEDVRYVL
jgi:hypothetical protein